MKNQHFIQRDLASVWHPCTQMKDHENQLPLIPIKRGEGIWLEDFEGRRYIDGISSWWVNLFGHANPRINAAIIAQLQQLEHVILAGFSHEPVIELSEKLIAITPKDLTRCFYADNGSSAIEVALKMSFHYWQNQGQLKKTRFITLQHSYHGETLGALAVGDVALYKKTYKPLLMESFIVPSPAGCDAESGESYADYAQRQFEIMARLLAEKAEEISAVIVEPLIQCAGGMRIYDPIYLCLLRQACDHYGVHLIADEIAVGFGRTGTLFACEQAEISPDFLCLSKGLTGGYLPLSVILTRENIYQAFYQNDERLGFLHSHSYTGNPLACQAALATLAIFEQDQVIENNKNLAKTLQEALTPLRDHPHVGDVRQLGMIAAVELVADKARRVPYPAQERRGLQFYRAALDQGALLRPLGNVIYFMPPYVITAAQLQDLVTIAHRAIDIATHV
ncbi:adenosylmethionine--8-amino-7-oxononanoate transaminase [Thioflexithrix psekupsensis]|uniref:Adenosylmethionine-8-amino-7-oxononanoate aminotransferase n=1 Tax=Thioflexithrix psekupsensis TaxID=1570016 RepID=A0A251XAS3_9GAMM|nr:adenosylmethionine--8-amino-7-oxononanoate transaminase [Thioflexithrix psekupsensis]OUD15469.1 adenosylmethionine--8-amino-7-oxononanoate transaminase [Thioflexithrix psekupsensis]